MSAKQQTDSNHSRQGLVLKQAREAKGIKLEAVHEVTKIPLDALRAIEEGYTIRTLTTFYYRGFLKIYARYLGVKLEDVLGDDLVEKSAEQKDQPRVQKEKDSFSSQSFFQVISPGWKNKAIKIFVGAAVLFLAVKGCNLIFHKKPVANAGAKVSLQEMRRNEKIRTQKSSLKTSAPASSEKKKVTSAVIPSPKSDQPSAVPVAKSAVNPSDKESIDLVVRAKKDCWLEVKADGATVFRSTLKKGAIETWHAAKTIELSGKDISDLELELNGKILGPLASANRKAKKVMIDHSGFSVKK